MAEYEVLMAEYEAYDYMMFVCQNCCIYVCNGLF